MDGIDGLAFAAGMARVAGTMMVFPSLRLIVVVEDGGSLVLWKVLAAVVRSVERRIKAGAEDWRGSFHHLCQPVGDGLPVLEQRRARLLFPCLLGRGRRRLRGQLPRRAEAARGRGS